MILLGLGGNLPSPKFGSPQETLEAALAALEACGLKLVRRSSWYESSAVPPSDQPNFINGVAEVTTDLSPAEVLQVLHEVEEDIGRVRRIRWEARIVDLDLLAYDDEVSGSLDTQLEDITLPHPRMHERRFVLAPLVELAPDWRHPVLQRTAAELLSALPEGDMVTRLEE